MADLASLELSVSNLLFTLTAACPGSVHVHKDHLKDSFLPFHPCVLPSVSPPLSCFLYLCGSAHRADGCSRSKSLKGGKLFIYPVPFQSFGSSSFFLWHWRTVFCVWRWSPGLSLGFLSTSAFLAWVLR